MAPDSTEWGSEGAEKRKSSPANGRRILIVDDEEAVAKSLKMVLTNLGHSIEIAENVEQALKLFDNAKYDLIMTDFALGKLTGLDLARAIKSKSPSMPIILITAYAESLSAGTGRLSDFVCVLGKPFSLQEIQGAIAKAFA